MINCINLLSLIRNTHFSVSTADERGGKDYSTDLTMLHKRRRHFKTSQTTAFSNAQVFDSFKYKATLFGNMKTVNGQVQP